VCSNVVKFVRREIGEIVHYLLDQKNFCCLSYCRYCAVCTQIVPGLAPNNVLTVLQISSKSVHFRRSYGWAREKFCPIGYFHDSPEAMLRFGQIITPFPPLFLPCPFTSLSCALFYFFPFSFVIRFIYFLLLSIPSLFTWIVPLRFQAGRRRKRPNLGLVCLVHFVLSVLLS